jgi:hypothetical protein
VNPKKAGLIRVVKEPALSLSNGPKRLPEHQLTARQLTDLERWVTIGAPDPRTEPLGASTEKIKPAPDFNDGASILVLSARRRAGLSPR